MFTYDVEALKQAVHERLPIAKELSDALYAEPEVAYHEVKSSQRIVKILKENGFEVEYPYLEDVLGYGTAFRAVLHNGEGPSVAIMVEYDALPGLGHGCGHNCHGSMAVLAGISLMAQKEQFKGTLYLIGTPAEEENGAKIAMVQEKVFEGMDMALMIHSSSGGVSQTDMDVLSLRCYEIEFFGLNAHAVAGPWQGHSALAAARKFMDLVDARRECFSPDIFVNSIIQDGGKSPNMIPDYARLRCEFRTGSRKKLSDLDDIIHKCAEGAAMALDCTVKYEPGLSDFWDMVRVEPLERRSREIMESLGEVVADPSPAAGSSDVGNVSYQCPAIQMLLSITDEPCALHTVTLREATHSPKGYEQLEKGAVTIASMVLSIFTNEEFRNEVHDAFIEARNKKL